MDCTPRLRCITDNPRIIKTQVQSSSAVGILPGYMCGDLRADRRLRVTPLPKGRDAPAAGAEPFKRDPAARTVIDWICDCFRRFSLA